MWRAASIAALLVVGACGDPQAIKTAKEPTVIGKNGACQVVRLYDQGQFVYVTDCTGGEVRWQTQTYCGKACWQTEDHASIRADENSPYNRQNRAPDLTGKRR